MGKVGETRLPEIEEIVAHLRERLARNNIAYGALYIVSSDGQNMLVMADGMPNEMRVDLLDELVETAIELRDHYKSMM